MRRKRTHHTNYLPALCIGVCALLFVLALGLLLHRCCAPDAPEALPKEQIALLDEGQDVTLQFQNPQLPNGCEVTSLSMLLDWAGYGVDKVALYEGYLPRQDFTDTLDGNLVGGDPELVYVGDATSELGGWYCFEGPIVEAGNAYLQDQGSSWRVEAVSGLSQYQLNAYLEADTPVIVWVTLDYTPPVDSLRNWYLPDGTFYQPLSNLHCVVVVEWNQDGYLTADPLKGWQWVEESSFWDTFEAMGCRAVIINE